MKYRVLGTSDKREMFRCLEPSDFNSNTHNAVSIGQDRNEQVVVVMHSKETKPLPWKVVYGMSHVYFRTFDEAIEFCNSRGMEIMKGNM